MLTTSSYGISAEVFPAYYHTGDECGCKATWVRCQELEIVEKNHNQINKTLPQLIKKTV